jgi:hypothetical protein
MIQIGGRSKENGLEMIDDDKIPDTYPYGMTERKWRSPTT